MPIAKPPNIIDFEASGFGTDSYPIEVGAVRSDGTRYCALIQPAPDWNHWDEGAEKVHRITREILKTRGRPIPEVAGTLNDLLRHRTAYTDGWVVDKTWLDRLYYAAGFPCEFSLSPLDLIMKESQMAAWHKTKNDVMHDLGLLRHRASFDAQVVQETFERTRKALREPDVRPGRAFK